MLKEKDEIGEPCETTSTLFECQDTTAAVEWLGGGGGDSRLKRGVNADT